MLHLRFSMPLHFMMLYGSALLLMVLALSSLFTVSLRHYRDLRDLKTNIEMDFTETALPSLTENMGENPMAALIGDPEDIKPAPWWLDYIFYGLTTLIFVLLALALVKKVLTVFQDFRITNDENGDIVISFNEGDVAPMYMGCVEFTVPKDALSAIRK